MIIERLLCASKMKSETKEEEILGLNGQFKERDKTLINLECLY